MSQNSSTTISFVSDTNGFFQYRINNITGLSPTPDCTMNFVTDPFFFYDIAVTPVVNIDILGANYTGASSGALFSLPVPAADAIYQVCVGVVDPLMQYTFLGGLQGILFTQDSVPPVTSFTTPPASYTAATNAPVACSDNVSGCDLIAYTTSTSATPTPPLTPSLPVIDPITHTVTAGTLYSAPLALADATQTTISAISMDLAGNPGTLQTASYIVDTTAPVITIDPASTSAISSVAGYDIASLTWSTNRTSLNYIIKSGVDCATGTPITGLSGSTPATANTNITNLINSTQLAAGANTIWVCVDNLAAVTGSNSHLITRDNTPPSITLNPLPGNFTTPTNLAMTCTDTGGSTCAVTGYTKSTSTTPALPAAPAAPALVVATKTVAAGTTQYTAPVALADATQSLFSFIAMDNVGNIGTVTTTATPYIVETALPAITVSATTVNGVSSALLGANTPYNIATITWSANRTNLNYTVKSGTCATGTPVANSTAMATPNLTGVTPATANTAVTTLINQADLANGANSISICVTNLALNDGAANFTLNKDTTPPSVSISPAAGNFTTATNFVLTCTDTGGSGCAVTGYTKSTSTTPALPAAPAAPALVVATKTVAAGTTQYTAPVVLADATQTLISYIAMDNVGNVATVQTTATPYIVDTTLPTVTVSGTSVNGVSSTLLGVNNPYDIATITWSANRTNLNYTVKSGTCATGTPVANSTAMATPNLSGTTPATANTAVTTLINQADLVAWLFLFFSMIIYLIYSLGKLPEHSILKNTIYYGSALEHITLSIALIYRYRSAQFDNITLEKTRAVLALESLTERMKPHFLFNSLNTIYSMIQKKDEKAEDAIIDLSNLYRFLTNINGNSLIHFSEEWIFIENYLAMMKHRHGDNFITLHTIDINSPILKVEIPPLTIQPLVENCFKHNNFDEKNKLRIAITVKNCNPDGLEFIIENNLCNIQNKTTSSPQTPTFQNIITRLQYYYNNVTLDCYSGADKTTCTTTLCFSDKKNEKI